MSEWVSQTKMVDSFAFLYTSLTLLLLSSALVLGRHVHYSVCVNVECNLDLRNPSRSWGDSNLGERGEKKRTASTHLKIGTCIYY